MSLASLWSGRFDQPVFVLTADQDWAPDWALRAFYALLARLDIPVHLFVTNESEALTQGADLALSVSHGIHPNFSSDSTQGGNPDEVLETCLRIVPTARTFRSHRFGEDTPILLKLRRAGFEADSNLCLLAQPGLEPLVHATGMLRFPVFLEDDVFFGVSPSELDMAPLIAAMLAPGLKVFNFHPALVAINAPSREYYDAQRPHLYAHADAPLEPFKGRGVATVLHELVSIARDHGHEFIRFDQLVRDCVRSLSQTEDWAPNAWRDRDWA